MMTLDDSTELCRLLGDPTRARLIAILAEEELTVAEITQITQLSQSRVSTHLGKLREARVVRDRRVGTSCYYALTLDALAEPARQVVQVLRDTTDDPLVEQDLGRMSEVVRGRDGGNWADSVAGRMHRHYSPGRTWEAAARGLLGWTHLGEVLDVASGDGVLAELIAPRSTVVTCLDLSSRVIAAGRKRLGHLDQVHFVKGDMHDLPFENARFDQVSLMNALTYSTKPQRVIDEASRVLKDGGTLVGSTLNQHSHREVVAQYNHTQPGFTPDTVRSLLEEADLAVELCSLTCRERRKPYFEIITFHARRKKRG